MGRILDFAVRVSETFGGPRDWELSRQGNATTYRGYFLIYSGGWGGFVRMRVEGRIVEWRRLPAEVFLYDPPSFVKNHRHGSCLQLLRPHDRWFKMHFERPATDFASAYSYVELFLNEAYNHKD